MKPLPQVGEHKHTILMTFFDAKKAMTYAEGVSIHGRLARPGILMRRYEQCVDSGWLLRCGDLYSLAPDLREHFKKHAKPKVVSIVVPPRAVTQKDWSGKYSISARGPRDTEDPVEREHITIGRTKVTTREYSDG